MQVDVGTTIPVWRLEGVDPARMKTMAVLLRDPNPIHFDVEALRRLGMDERPVNQGPNNIGYVFNMLVEWLGDPALVRRVKVRFQGNVLAGDVVEAAGEVIEVSGDAGDRVARCDVWLQREDGDRVLGGWAEVTIPE